jgi:hypothetical protein
MAVAISATGADSADNGFGSQQRLQGAHHVQSCLALNGDMTLIEIDESDLAVSAAKRCTARAPMPVQNSRCPPSRLLLGHRDQKPLRYGHQRFCRSQIGQPLDQGAMGRFGLDHDPRKVRAGKYHFY